MTSGLKAQIAGQVFIYILSLIIVSLVLLYGYNAIQDFRIKAEEVNLVNFKNELENVVVKSTRHGDTKPIELSLSGKFEKVCFVDSFSSLSEAEKSSTCLCTAGCSNTDPLICDAWKTTNASNVYLVPLANIPINIGPTTVDGNDDGAEDTASNCAGINCFYLCATNTHGKIKLTLFGKGNHIFIKLR